MHTHVVTYVEVRGHCQHPPSSLLPISFEAWSLIEPASLRFHTGPLELQGRVYPSTRVTGSQRCGATALGSYRSARNQTQILALAGIFQASSSQVLALFFIIKNKYRCTIMKSDLKSKLIPLATFISILHIVSPSHMEVQSKAKTLDKYEILSTHVTLLCQGGDTHAAWMGDTQPTAPFLLVPAML